jgi:type IV fimbrial biogenesis protein FimT
MQSFGFTLWELLCSLTVTGIALGLAAPSFETFILDSRRTADINALFLAIQLARSESAKRGAPVVLCKTADLLQCGGNEIRYDTGWMVFVNEDGVRPPDRSEDESLLFVHEPEIIGRITSNRDLYEFRPYRKRSTNGSVVFCDQRGALAARVVIVSYTGRPRVSDRDASGRTLKCASDT